MKTITVFTPTYNRAYTLHKCYNSLVRQNSKDFIWLIIDDGSTDNTKSLIQDWVNENVIEIQYIYQENQGMHGAHNTAYEHISTELNVCIDSDDYLADDAIQKILELWNQHKSEQISGIAALNCSAGGEIIGTRFPHNVNYSTYFDLYHRYKMKGDKKFIYKTEYTRLYPYPTFQGEKYVGLDYKYSLIDKHGKLALLNEIACVVEYMEDGSSKNMLFQYKNNPNGFIFYRSARLMDQRSTFTLRFKDCIHYVSSNLIAKKMNFISESPAKILTILALPFGGLLYSYIMIKTKIRTT